MQLSVLCEVVILTIFNPSFMNKLSEINQNVAISPEFIFGVHICLYYYFLSQKILVCLPFLDTLVKRKADGSLDTSVYCKNTHRDRYLDFYSYHPNHVRNGLVKSFFKRPTPLLQAILIYCLKLNI